MKFKTSQREIMSSYQDVIEVTYCGLQHLLRSIDPVAYTSGTYGWNADVYDIDGTAIVTGNRPFGNIVPPYELVREYDEKAREIYNNARTPADYDRLNDELYGLAKRFIADAKASKKGAKKTAPNKGNAKKTASKNKKARR